MLSKLLKSLVKENVCLECFHLNVVKRRNEAARQFTDGDTGRLEIKIKGKKSRPMTNQRARSFASPYKLRHSFAVFYSERSCVDNILEDLCVLVALPPPQLWLM